jgi:hypothetical protein
MKHTHAAEVYANRSHKEIEPVFTKFNRGTYFNFNFINNFNFNYDKQCSEQFSITRTPDDGSIQPKDVENTD